MSDRLINGVVLRRIKEAEDKGDVELLEGHLRCNYDVEIHSAVYAALYRMGRKSLIDKADKL